METIISEQNTPELFLDDTGSGPKFKNQSIFHNLSTSDALPESVYLDHCYAKAWNLHPEADHVRPAKILFMKGVLFNPIENVYRDGEDIDIEAPDPKPIPTYDTTKAKISMKECERFININQDDSELENWEDKISKVTWSAAQKSLFDKVLKVLQTERLTLLANHQNANEPILRRLAVDKMSSRLRYIFASISWDMTLLQWLHQTLCDVLPQIFLSQYLDVLQTLKSKAPTLVDKMLIGSKNIESLQHLLKRPWDPLSSLLNQHKVKRLPKNPLIVWTPGDPAYSCVGLSRRMKFWHSQLSNLGKLITVNPQVNQGVTIGDSLDAIITAVRYEVMELKMNFPNRAIILVGWTIGALIACQVALVESISAIVCLGFPLTGVNGSRGDLDDPLLENRTPTLFVIGQKASMCSLDDIEDFRERMRAESGLVVIGGADDHLRVCRMKKQLEGINQNIVDRCIVDEMYNFLAAVLNHSSLLAAELLSEKASKLDAPKRKRKSASTFDPPYEPTFVPKPKVKKNSFSYMSTFSGNVSPSSPGSTTTESSSTTSSAGESLMEKVYKNVRNSNPPMTTSNLSTNLQNIQNLVKIPSSAGPTFMPIDLPPTTFAEREEKALFFSQQLGLPVISPSISTSASIVMSSILNPITSAPAPIFTSHINQPLTSTSTFATILQAAPSPSKIQGNIQGTTSNSGRLVLPKGNSPPGLSVNIGSLSSLTNMRQTQSPKPPSPKPFMSRSIRPKAPPQIFPPTINPLYGKRIIPSTTTSSIVLTTQKIVSNQQHSSNLSYLTMANPMLSNILANSRSTPPPPAHVQHQKASYDSSSLPAPLSLVKSTVSESQNERIRTYMRTPQKNTNINSGIVRTTTYVKAPPSRTSDSSTVTVASISGGQSLINPRGATSLAQLTSTTKTNGARKVQVITFLKPPPLSNNGSGKEIKTTTTVPKPVVPQSQATKLSSPENASGTLRLISSAIRVAEQKHSTSTETSEDHGRKISLARLSNDFQSEYLKNVIKQPSVVEEPEVQIIESASIPTIILEGKSDSVEEYQVPLMDLEPESEPEPHISEDSQPLSDESQIPIQNFMMEPITTDTAPITFVTSSTGVVDSAITDRLSHLSAGTQEAILALTQLSELA